MKNIDGEFEEIQQYPRWMIALAAKIRELRDRNIENGKTKGHSA